MWEAPAPQYLPPTHTLELGPGPLLEAHLDIVFSNDSLRLRVKQSLSVSIVSRSILRKGPVTAVSQVGLCAVQCFSMCGDFCCDFAYP